MLMNGRGLPTPQVEAAGLYWRLAASSGAEDAEVQLAKLLRDRKIPFRPDLGASEVKALYERAVARRLPVAALELGRLYRRGYTSEDETIIEKSAPDAIAKFQQAIDFTLKADPESEYADPANAYLPAFEIIEMYDNGEAKSDDGTQLVSEARITELRNTYGDPRRRHFFKVPVSRCTTWLDHMWVELWEWTRDEPPSEAQFQWFERYWQKYFAREIALEKDRLRKQNEQATRASDRVDLKKIKYCEINKTYREAFNAVYRTSKDKKESYIDAMIKRYDEFFKRRG
jgi:hypothetical protein